MQETHGISKLFYGDLVIKQKMITGMKRIHDYIMLAIVAFASVGCTEEIIDPNGPAAETEKEVQFGLSLGKGLDTRTIYGQQSGNAFPIYWVDEDKVTVYSPQCLKDRNLAEYKVEVATTEQNFVNTLTKTGDFGVQWGSDAADFYSIYPSGDYNISEDGTKIQNLRIGYTQDVYLEPDGITLKNMSDCLMYAKTNGAVTPGNTVNLTYKPIATAIMVELGVAELSPVQSFTIQSVKLTAPTGTNIAGNFNVNLVDGSYAELGTVSNSITLQVSNSATGGFYVLTYGKDIQLPIFILPIEGLNMDKDQSVSTDNWIIEVVTDQKTFKKTLSGENLAIKPGQVHKLTLPKLTTAATTWDPNDWMVHVPRNVYLSEVSIPGTWNSLNEDCQSNTSISDQYGLGVRAFHLDTRWRADNKPLIGSTFTGWTTPTITELSVATGGSGNTYKYDGVNLMKPEFESFADYLKQITDNVKDNEYMVVFCTFSQNSYNGDLCPTTWFTAISNACAANDRVYDASGITANTVVGEVLDKVIVIVNLDSSVSSSALPASSKCLFTYVPMQLPENYYAETSSHIDALYYGTKNETGISMYTSHAQISTTGTSSVNCNERGYSHPLTSRDNLVTSFWDWSKSNYGTTNYSHDKWIYLGLGGYIMNSSSSNGTGYNTIENRYAPMVYNRIDEMGKNDVPYYPVGIILMNNKHGGNYTTTNTSGTTTTLTYDFADVCEKILLLNNAYRLQYDPSKPSDYNPNATPKSAAPSYSSGMNDSNVSAFGWD